MLLPTMKKFEESHEIQAERLNELWRLFRRGRRFASFCLLLLGTMSFILLFGLLVRFLAVEGWQDDQLRGVAGGASALALLLLIFLAQRRRRHSELLYRLRCLGAVMGAGFQDKLLRAAQLEQEQWFIVRNQQPPAETEALALAHLHYDRQLDQIAPVQVIRQSRRLRRRTFSFVWLALALSLTLTMTQLVNVIEGYQVGTQALGQPSLKISYLRSLRVEAQFPEYLGLESNRRRLFNARISVPRGTQLHFSMKMNVEERQFILTDGEEEIPLSQDGQGRWVGTWLVDKGCSLRVATKIGEYILYDVNKKLIIPINDMPPLVTLQGAGKEMRLSELEELPLPWFAQDDYGLKQVELVLRSGSIEERRSLAEMAGRTRRKKGATRLLPGDRFFRDAFLPIDVWVEARDANNIFGPGIGRSEKLVLIPEALGEQLSQRHLLYLEFRSQLVDYFAADLLAASLSLSEGRKKQGQALELLQQQWLEFERRVREKSASSDGLLRFLRGQIEFLKQGGSDAIRPESLLMAFDSVSRQMALKDAQKLAQIMAAVFEELAVSAENALFLDAEKAPGLEPQLDGEALSSSSSTRSPQEAMTRYFEIVRAAGKELEKLGIRGDDLGAVTRGELKRLDGLIKQEQFDRVRLVALHIAARLARGTASFGAKGSPGVESSGGSGGDSSGEGGESSSSAKGSPGDSAAEQKKTDFDQMMDELSGLSQEHQSQVDEMERLIQQALEALQNGQQSPQANEQAENLRQAARKLPTHGARPGGLRSEAALLRNRAESMADALERGDAAEAILEAQDAEQALKRARQQLGTDYAVSQENLEGMSQALKEALAFARRQAQQAGRDQHLDQAQQRQERASRERAIAEALSELSRRAQAEGVVLPMGDRNALAQAERNMRAAAESLNQGDVRRSIELAKDAQRSLEQVAPEQAKKAKSGGRDGEGQHGDLDEIVPDKDDVDPKALFRRRVNEGLSKKSGPWEAIVRRYAQEIQ